MFAVQSVRRMVLFGETTSRVEASMMPCLVERAISQKESPEPGIK
jgi:hypothetical protein